MKTLLTSLALATLLPGLATAQTYFYVGSISVDPPSPTMTDAIIITLHGTFGSTGGYIVSINTTVVNDTVMIAIVAADPGGATVPVLHDEPIPIGTLPAGDYTIHVNGTNVTDGASPPQHLFTVTGSGTSVIGPLAPSAGVLVTMDGEQLLVTALDGSALGELMLVDIRGRIAVRQLGLGNNAHVDLANITSGAYVLLMNDRSTAQRVIVSGR